MEKKVKRSSILYVRVRKETLQVIKHQAKTLGYSRSDLVDNVLHDYFFAKTAMKRAKNASNKRQVSTRS